MILDMWFAKLVTHTWGCWSYHLESKQHRMVFMRIWRLHMLKTRTWDPKVWGWIKYDNSRIWLKSLVFCRGGRFLVFDHAPFSSIRGEKCEMKLHGPHKNLFRLFLLHNTQGTQAEFLFSTETQWDGAVQRSCGEGELEAQERSGTKAGSVSRK